MAADFKLKDGDFVRTTLASIASATVVEAGDVVELDTGLIVKGTATGAALAWTPGGSAAGETEIEVTVGNDFTLLGTGDAAFAVTQKGTEVDLVVDTGVQLIDVGASSTDVFKIGISTDSGTVGSTADIEVKINKPLF